MKHPRLAVLRDPQIGGRTRLAVRRPQDRRGPASPPRREEPPQRAHDGPHAVRAVAAHTYAHSFLALASVQMYGVLGHVVIAAYMALDAGPLHRLLHPGGTLRHVVPQAAPHAVLHLRPRLLVARAPVEGPGPLPEHLQRNPLQDSCLATAGDVRIGSRVFDDGCYLTERTLHRHRRRIHPQRREQDPVPLAGGRHLQVRRHHARYRLHAGRRRARALRRDDGRRRGTGARFLPR
ncbi:hypothetical protein SHIRM173S_12786 [Streptomyces hirsutus]